MLSNKQTTNINILLALTFTTALLYCYWSTLIGLIKVWSASEDYSHGFFIIPVCIYIIWTKRKELIEIEPKPSICGLIISILSLLIYAISKFAGITTLASVSIVPFVAGSIYYLFGKKVLRMLAFPIFFLLFMIPIPSQIYSAFTIPLQLFVSKVSVGISQLFHVAVLREGNVIHLPNYTMQVVQACSGLRSMISLMTLSAVFSYLVMRSNLIRSLLFLSGIPIAILVNVVRVTLTVLIYYYFQFNLAEGAVHTVFGVFIFGLAFALLFGMKGVLSFWEKA